MSKTLAEVLEALELILKTTWPLEMRQGDAMQWQNPHAQQMVNSNIYWLTTQGERTGHRLYRALESLNLLPAIIRQQAADIKALREEAQRIFEQGHYTMQDYDRLKAVLAATDPNRPLGEDA